MVCVLDRLLLVGFDGRKAGSQALYFCPPHRPARILFLFREPCEVWYSIPARTIGHPILSVKRVASERGLSNDAGESGGQICGIGNQPNQARWYT